MVLSPQQVEVAVVVPSPQLGDHCSDKSEPGSFKNV